MPRGFERLIELDTRYEFERRAFLPGETLKLPHRSRADPVRDEHALGAPLLERFGHGLFSVDEHNAR